MQMIRPPKQSQIIGPGTDYLRVFRAVKTFILRVPFQYYHPGQCNSHIYIVPLILLMDLEATPQCCTRSSNHIRYPGLRFNGQSSIRTMYPRTMVRLGPTRKTRKPVRTPSVFLLHLLALTVVVACLREFNYLLPFKATYLRALPLLPPLDTAPH